jgi:transaldolase/glucose-6-phosphate isomerase
MPAIVNATTGDTAAMNRDLSALDTTSHPLVTLQHLGQSIWLDDIGRSLIASGELRRLVDTNGVTGVTANPSIFEKAIVESGDYDEAVLTLVQRGFRSDKAVYEALAIADVQGAADVLRPTYDRTAGGDGFVSLEVSPLLAHDTGATVAEARRLWARIDRDNAMIKVPGTPAAVAAIRQLTEDGINVNVTLLFSLRAYQAAAEAYVAGLENRLSRGLDVRGVTSVASFFVSRIDTAVDALLAAQSKPASSPNDATVLDSLLGTAAIANAKLAYEWYQQFTATPRWQAVRARGARPQRLLWASTSTKNPRYRDVLYVEELIAPDTITTVTRATLDAFRDHGHARPSLTHAVTEARRTIEALDRAGISIDAVAARLLDTGIQSFVKAFDNLLGAIQRKISSRGVGGSQRP